MCRYYSGTVEMLEKIYKMELDRIEMHKLYVWCATYDFVSVFVTPL